MMKDFLRELPGQIPAASRIGFKTPVSSALKGRSFSNILFCGMGGSAISGDILRVYLSGESRVPFIVYRSGQTLPKWAGKGTLAILSSYSGNTREILDVVSVLGERRCDFLAVTSGGKLADIAHRKGITAIPIPPAMPPRCAIGYLTFSVLAVLSRLGVVPWHQKHVDEVFHLLKKFPLKAAAALAKKIAGRVVYLYGVSGTMEPVLTRWRAQLAENAKTLSSTHLIPEMFHNEIEGWVFPKKLLRQSAAIFFTDSGDPAVLRKKIAYARNKISRTGARVLAVKSSGKGILARMFSAIALGDWVSVELAGLYRTDPMPIPTLEAIKKL